MDKKIKIVTHNASFHSDDVFAVATLVLFLKDKEYEIIRTRDFEMIESADFVVDVGEVYDAEKNRFDHHQEGRAGQRENGIPYASFGLVWKKFGEEICGSLDVANKIDQILVQSIDSRDNGFEIVDTKIEGIYPYTIGQIIHSFVPNYKEEDANIDDFFFKALDLALVILKREIKVNKDTEEAQSILQNIYNASKDNQIFILDKRLPWEEFVSKNKKIVFVVSPKKNGSWAVETARDDLNSFENRKSLPKEWGGKRDEDLASVTGVEDAIFCHTGLFIAFAGSKEGAVRLAQLALQK